MAVTLIQTITAGAGGASSLDFTGIPNTFTDLMVVTSLRDNAGNPDSGSYESYFKIAFNGSATSFSNRYLRGNGSAVNSYANGWEFYPTPNAVGAISGSGATANTFGNSSIYIPNYAGATNKSWSADSVGETNGTIASQTIMAGLWSNTSAIASISLTPGFGSAFVQGSTASLYGVKKDNILPAPKATGGTISFSGGYWYHTFTASDNFVPSQTLTCDYLIVAGGGGGSTGYGGTGGGGAGGYRAFAGQSFTAGTYAVTVGAGGAIGGGGSNSSFNSLTSAGGGRGGYYNIVGGSGGSGGGAGTNTGDVIGTGNSPATSPSQGNNGGRQTTGSGGAGGGGGASAVGASTSGSAGGAGGAGATWLNGVTYAGGGGGAGYAPSAGGAGGGGAGGGYGSGSGNGVAGTANTGGGGGGGGGNGGPNSGGAGGSGVVIVRYAA